MFKYLSDKILDKNDLVLAHHNHEWPESFNVTRNRFQRLLRNSKCAQRILKCVNIIKT